MWCISFDIDERTPDHSVLAKARRQFGVTTYRAFFTEIVRQCEQAGLVQGNCRSVDSTLVKANASMAAVGRGRSWSNNSPVATSTGQPSGGQSSGRTSGTGRGTPCEHRHALDRCPIRSDGRCRGAVVASPGSVAHANRRGRRRADLRRSASARSRRSIERVARWGERTGREPD